VTLGNEKTEVFLFWMFARKTVLHPITGRTDRQSATQYAAPPREERRIISLVRLCASLTASRK